MKKEKRYAVNFLYSPDGRMGRTSDGTTIWFFGTTEVKARGKREAYTSVLTGLGNDFHENPIIDDDGQPITRIKFVILSILRIPDEYAENDLKNENFSVETSCGWEPDSIPAQLKKKENEEGVTPDGKNERTESDAGRDD